MNSRTHFCFKSIHILNDSVAADVSVVADLRGECVGLILNQFIYDMN